ncbi:hypothetical protein PQR53_34340 [Paraburkholderia fungorum]|uniref:hypothetical protein n=1 Tax=Paraburkholderia fungorum TaxID=134537 RepID=UPI0038BBA1C3
MEFDSDWVTLGRHRVRLRSPQGFPTEGMRTAVDVMRLAIENNMSARARLVEAAVREEKTYELSIGTTFADDQLCVPQLESATAVVLGLLPQQVRIFVTVVTQQEVDLHFGVYERMLAEKIGGLPPIGHELPVHARETRET